MNVHSCAISCDSRDSPPKAVVASLSAVTNFEIVGWFGNCAYPFQRHGKPH